MVLVQDKNSGLYFLKIRQRKDVFQYVKSSSNSERVSNNNKRIPTNLNVPTILFILAKKEIWIRFNLIHPMLKDIYNFITFFLASLDKSYTEF